MYDYVISFLFDDKTTKIIEKIKENLDSNKIVNKERPWPPHITIDLYKNVSLEQLISNIDLYVRHLKSFNITFEETSNFNNRVLVLRPKEKEKLIDIKERFNKLLDKYRLEDKRNKDYRPHVTLRINDDTTVAEAIVNGNFKTFVGKVNCICIFNRNMEIMKKYDLK